MSGSQRDYPERLFHEMVDIENELIGIRKLLECLVSLHEPKTMSVIINPAASATATSGNAVTVNPGDPAEDR